MTWRTETLPEPVRAMATRPRDEAVAAATPLLDTPHFTAKCRAIRAALAEDGVAAEMEALVDALLPP